ncbi:MAG: hypothetical protein JWM34_1605 [Ilumatobacteraceae bacterium]|nr:hypothetical protein [Ilumatobacteraceae bacterium]
MACSAATDDDQRTVADIVDVRHVQPLPVNIVDKRGSGPWVQTRAVSTYQHGLGTLTGPE